MTDDRVFDIFGYDDPTEDDIKDWQDDNEANATEFTDIDFIKARNLATELGIPRPFYRTATIARNNWGDQLIRGLRAKNCMIIYDDEWATLFKLHAE